MYENRLGQSPATTIEREARVSGPTFATIAGGVTDAINRLAGIEGLSESIASRLIGYGPAPEKENPDAPTPYGALPELMSALQVLHVRLGRIERNLNAVSATLP